MEMLVEIVALCLVTSVLALVVKQSTPEMGLVLVLACAVVGLLRLGTSIGEVVAFLNHLGELGGLPSQLIAPLLKTVGIALVVKVGGNLCRDAGASALGAVVELAGSVCALLVALPLVELVLERLMELMG